MKSPVYTNPLPLRGLIPLIRYRLPGLRDAYLSYAGTFCPEHKIHDLLHQLSTGEPVLLKQLHQKVMLFNQVLDTEQAVAILSRAESQQLIQKKWIKKEWIQKEGKYK